MPTAFGRCVILTWAMLHMYIKQYRKHTQIEWGWGTILEGDTT